MSKKTAPKNSKKVKALRKEKKMRYISEKTLSEKNLTTVSAPEVTTEMKNPEEKRDRKIIKAGNLTIVKFDDTPRNVKFEKLVTKTQEELKAYLADYFRKEGKSVTEAKGYLYIDGNFPVMLTAHLDTVHNELPKEICYENGMIYSPQGIGGDDRCGVYAIMRILKEIDCPVVFCEDEEIGGVGSNEFAGSKISDRLYKEKKVKYVIDLDRKGSHDAVYYSLNNPEFERFVEKEFWKMSWGSFTDICNICPDLGVAGVNLSVGYYNQHTLSEYVVLKEMEKAIEETKALIRRTDPAKEFEYVEDETPFSSWWSTGTSYYSTKKYGSYGTKYGSYGTDFFYVTFYGEKGEETEFIEAVSEMEALGYFMAGHPDLTYNDVIEIGYEEEYEYQYPAANGNEVYL